MRVPLPPNGGWYVRAAKKEREIRSTNSLYRRFMATGLAPGIETDFSGNINTSFPTGFSQTGQLQYQTCVHTDISKLVEALTLAQADFLPLWKESENPFYKSK